MKNSVCFSVCIRMLFGVLGVVSFSAYTAEPAVDPKATKDEIQFVEGQLPPTANSGEIWCLVTKSPVYKSVTEKVMIRPATFYFETVPATYEAKEEQVLIEPEKQRAITIPAHYKMETVQKLLKEESYEYQVVPPVYKWEEEQVEVSPTKEQMSVSDAMYKIESEQVLVEPARTEWVKVACDDKNVNIQRRESKDDCYTMVSIPAKYETVSKQVLASSEKTDKQTHEARSKPIKVQKIVKPAEVKKVIIPAVYQSYEKEVLDTPAKVTYETVPAKYKTVKRQVLVGAESQKKVEVPAKYEMVTHDVLDQPAVIVWRRKSGGKDIVVSRYGSIPGISSCDNDLGTK